MRPEVPAELAALVARMMAKEPGQRFQAPAEVAQALTPFFSRKAAASAAADLGATQEVLRAAIPFADEVTETATAVVRSASPTTAGGMQDLMSMPEEIGATTVSLDQKECDPPANSSTAGKRQPTRRELAFTIVGLVAGLLVTVLVVTFERRHHASSFTSGTNLVAVDRGDGPPRDGSANRMEPPIDPKDGERSDAVTVRPGAEADSKRDHLTGPKVINSRPLDIAQGAGPPSAVQVSTDKASKPVGSHDPLIPAPGPLVNETLSWSGTVYIVRTEDRVHIKATEVKQRLTAYQERLRRVAESRGIHESRASRRGGPDPPNSRPEAGRGHTWRHTGETEK